VGDKYIQFVANYEGWVSIRKLAIEPATDPKTIMEFLAGLTTSVDSKVEENLRKIVALEKVDKAIEELGLGKKDTAKALEEVNSRKVGSAIKEITQSLEGFQKPEKKELEQFCRVYAMKKALKACGLGVDYSGVEIPGMKRVKKNKG
jgi:translation elongation factor EF-G